MRRLVFALLCVAVVCAGATPADACACGVALDASVARERALVVEHPDSEEIIASFDLATDAGGRAAVVLPVPGEPEVEAIEEGDPLAYLDLATRPKPEDDGNDTSGAPAGGVGGSQVDVIGREEVGGYDVTRLSASDPEALTDWLNENGYEMPDGAAPIFADYVDQGWSYVAIRLADDSSGRLKPLDIQFPLDLTDGPVYPMKLTQLGTDPVYLTLYVLADGPRRAGDLNVEYQSPVDDLDPQPPADIANLFEHSSHLTKFLVGGASPQAFTEDLAIVPGPLASVAGGATSDDDGGLDWWVYALIAFAVIDTIIVFLVLRQRQT